MGDHHRYRHCHRWKTDHQRQGNRYRRLEANGGRGARLLPWAWRRQRSTFPRRSRPRDRSPAGGSHESAGSSLSKVSTTLERRVDAAVSPRSNRFAVALFAETSQRRSFSQEESAAWERLQNGPLDVEQLSNEDRALTRALADWSVTASLFTAGSLRPDAAHVLDKASHWSTRAAELAAIVWARQMRQVWLGQVRGKRPKRASSAVEEHMVRTICAALVSACLATDPGETHHGERERTARLFSEWISGNSAVDGALFSPETR